MDITELSGPARQALANVEFHKARWLRAHQALSSAEAYVVAANRAMDVVTYEASEAGVPVDDLAYMLREDVRDTSDRVERARFTRTVGYRAVRAFGPGTPAVHVVTAIPRFPGKVALACTGRGMSDMVGTTQPVTCKACVRKLSRQALDLTAAGRRSEAARVLNVLS